MWVTEDEHRRLLERCLPERLPASFSAARTAVGGVLDKPQARQWF
ncbi:hypothetical protein [Salmonella enterica]|nr:hypothetical protein [Salmonella enterica]